MKTQTSQQILDYISTHKHVSPKDLYTFLKISPRAVFKQLTTLINKKAIQKIGQPPKVYYTLYHQETIQKLDSLDKATMDLIEQNYYFISAIGEEKIGIEGFKSWCNKENLPLTKTAQEYVQTYLKYNKYKIEGFIDGTQKIKNTFEQIMLDKVFYLDFYAIERFGKTKLGQLLLLAKSSQNKKQIANLIEIITPYVHSLIKTYDIDAVGFIPPTVKRQTQLMNELKNQLPLKQKILTIVKAKTSVTIAQKTLSKLQDRIENAQHTIIVEDKTPYNNILLIDDAIGSGATINETAAQIKRKGICQGKIIGLAIVGSFKGFDIISEV